MVLGINSTLVVVLYIWCTDFPRSNNYVLLQKVINTCTCAVRNKMGVQSVPFTSVASVNGYRNRTVTVKVMISS